MPLGNTNAAILDEPACARPAGSRRPIDALSLPLVAYRGLWDKFDGPGTMGAVRRAYRRGVPSLARIGQESVDLREIVAMVVDPATNRRQQPIYLACPSLPELTLTRQQAAIARIFTVRVTERNDQPWSIWRLTAGGWQAAGFYVPVRSPLAACPEDMWFSPLIMFESTNVIDGSLERRRLGARTDDDVLRAIREAAAPEVTITRVSDLAELDQLDLRIREAR